MAISIQESWAHCSSHGPGQFRLPALGRDKREGGGPREDRPPFGSTWSSGDIESHTLRDQNNFENQQHPTSRYNQKSQRARLVSDRLLGPTFQRESSLQHPLTLKDILGLEPMQAGSGLLKSAFLKDVAPPGVSEFDHDSASNP